MPAADSSSPRASTLSRTTHIVWALPFLLAFFPIVLLSVYAERIASGSVSHLVETQNISITENLSRLLVQEIGRTTMLADAVASLPATAAAIRERDDFSLANRLKAIIVTVPEIERAYVTDVRGAVMGGYPLESAQPGQKEARDPWYEEILDRPRTTVSSAYIPPKSLGQLVVGIASPVVETGALRGYLVFEYRARDIARWLANIELPTGGSLFVVDHSGRLVADSAHDATRSLIEEYADVAEIRAAIDGQYQTVEYDDPIQKERMIATFLPVTVGHNNWVIVAQRPVDIAFAELRQVRLKIAVAGAALTLVTLAMVIALARFSARNIRLNRELAVRNQSLREVASIVESSNDAIVGTRLDGTIHSWNSAAQAMYGYTAEEAIGHDVMVMLIPEEKRAERDEVLQRVRQGESTQNYETVRMKKNGEAIPVSITVSPVKNAAGDIVGFSSIDRDITERKKIEQMKNDFVSFVSHQLKAPITAMKWILESIMDGDDGEVPERMKGSIQQMQDSANQCSNLISDILNASRIERGVIAVDLKPVALADLVERSVKDYRVSCEKAGLNLVLVGIDQPITVMIDKEKCAEAVSNSISNAIKHTPKGGTITVTMYSEGAYGVIDVSDNGEGMPKDILEKLFTRTGIVGAGARPDRSSGLGLYIAKNFMEMQKGDVNVTSEVGKGTTFKYRVLLATPEDIRKASKIVKDEKK